MSIEATRVNPTSSYYDTVKDFTNLAIVPATIGFGSIAFAEGSMDLFKVNLSARKWIILLSAIGGSGAIATLVSMNVSTRKRFLAQLTIAFIAYEIVLVFWNLREQKPNLNMARWCCLFSIMSVLACYIRNTYDDIQIARKIGNAPDDFVPINNTNEDLIENQREEGSQPWYAFKPTQTVPHCALQTGQIALGIGSIILGTYLNSQYNFVPLSTGYLLTGSGLGNLACRVVSTFDSRLKEKWFADRTEAPYDETRKIAPKKVLALHYFKNAIADRFFVPTSVLLMAAFLNSYLPVWIASGFGFGWASYNADRAFENPQSITRHRITEISEEDLQGFAKKVAKCAAVFFPGVIFSFLAWKDYKAYSDMKDPDYDYYRIVWISSFYVAASLLTSSALSWLSARLWKQEKTPIRRHLRFHLENLTWLACTSIILDHASQRPVTNLDFIYLIGGLSATAASVGNNLYKIVDFEATDALQGRVRMFALVVALRNLWAISNLYSLPNQGK